VLRISKRPEPINLVHCPSRNRHEPFCYSCRHRPTPKNTLRGNPGCAVGPKTPTEATRAEATRASTKAEAIGAETGTNEDPNLETTLDDIDNMLLRMAEEEAVVVTATEKGKEQIEDILEKENFNFQDILGQGLSDAEKEELKKYVLSCGYKPGSLLFGGVNEGKLRCLRNRTEAKVLRTFSKSVGLPKIEADLCRYQRQLIAGSLLYANLKVKNSRFFIIIFFILN
jgi:hypothetical protein